MDVLVIDVGGSHVKLCLSPALDHRRFESGTHLTPEALVDQVTTQTQDWRYDVISVGYPGVTGVNRRRVDWFRLRARIRQTREARQRRGHAGARRV
jgi:polyphosphate glucokinase